MLKTTNQSFRNAMAAFAVTVLFAGCQATRLNTPHPFTTLFYSNELGQREALNAPHRDSADLTQGATGPATDNKL